MGTTGGEYGGELERRLAGEQAGAASGGPAPEEARCTGGILLRAGRRVAAGARSAAACAARGSGSAARGGKRVAPLVRRHDASKRLLRVGARVTSGVGSACSSSPSVEVEPRAARVRLHGELALRAGLSASPGARICGPGAPISCSLASSGRRLVTRLSPSGAELARRARQARSLGPPWAVASELAAPFAHVSGGARGLRSACDDGALAPRKASGGSARSLSMLEKLSSVQAFVAHPWCRLCGWLEFRHCGC